VALGGTGAYAANTVFSSDIVDGEVKTPDLATDAVTTPKLRNGAVERTKLGSVSVSTEKINNSAVTSNKLRDDDVTGTDVLESSLGQVPLASAAGKAPVEGYEVLWKVNPPGQTVESERDVSIDCPGGKRPVGGGAYAYPNPISGQNQIGIIESKPTGAIYSTGTNTGYAVPTGWYVKARAMQDPFNSSFGVGVYVLCAKTDS
jgi:hypothetical protein